MNFSSPTLKMYPKTAKPRRCRVEAISFSAHADFEQTSGFLDALRPPHVVLVHGEVEGMKRLREALERGAAAQGFERRVHMPPAGRAVLVAHKCVLASSPPLLLVCCCAALLPQRRRCRGACMQLLTPTASSLHAPSPSRR